MGNSFKSCKDLEVWQKGMALVKEVYKVTNDFPGEEKFGLVNQIRRAVVSIPSNIAEGHARSGTGEFKHFISIAMGSVAESETQLILSAELGYLNEDATTVLLDQLDIIGKMLRGLYKSLETRGSLWGRWYC
ncbi:MAG: four helix bundle protein [Calditrichaeota bacterium]|nr:four helix bundle protein [Calditrichota bacterium]